MSRIGTILSGTEFMLLNRLAKNQAAATLSALRLTSGHVINAPSDDPSGFVQLSGMQSRLALVQQSARNVTAATSIASQTQLKLDQIHTQISAIRTALLTDEDGSLTTDQRSTQQATIDAALATIDSLSSSDIGGRSLLAGAAAIRTSGRNASQVTSVSVSSAAGDMRTSSGSQAVLTYTGANGLTVDNSNITILGKSGGLTINVATTDSLAEIAHKINGDTARTGVAAEAVGNNLYLRSTGASSQDWVRVVTNSGDDFAVTGATSGGKAFGSDPQIGSGPAITGTVERAATQGLLVHDAGGATIAADADITITGRRGAATISVLASENLSLAQFAQRVNQQSHVTGVVATTSGAKINLTSVDYGNHASVAVQVNSGSFATVNADGDAATASHGLDAIATINGIRRTGNVDEASPQLVHHTAAGTLTTNARFELTGPQGTHEFTINVGLDNTLAGLRTSINTAAPTTGVTATIDGNDLVLTTSQTGSEAKIELRVLSGTFSIDGGNGDGTAQGVDEVTNNSVVNGNRITIADDNLHATIEFAPGFTGNFNPIHIDGGGLEFNLFGDERRPTKLALSGIDTSTLGGVSGTLDDLASGGAAAGLGSNTSRGLRIVDEALGQLGRVQGAVDGFANATIASAAALSSSLEDTLGKSIDSIDKVDKARESILLDKNQALASNAIASLTILGQQRTRIVDLIQKLAGL